MMASPETLRFLNCFEKRVFKQVLYAVRDEDAALDIIQDAMIKLYKITEIEILCELPAAFTQVCRNCTNDC
jgi:RNA polymerase sigma-70 factor (ECF subfamily)